MIKDTRTSQKQQRRWTQSKNLATTFVALMLIGSIEAVSATPSSADWIMSSSLAIQTDNDFYYDHASSAKPQLLLKIDPPQPATRVHVYGSEDGRNLTKFFHLGPSGYVGIDGYKNGALLCFIVVQPSPLEALLRWYENCHQLDNDDNSMESIDVDLEALTQIRRLFVKGLSSLDRPIIPMASSPSILTLISPIELSSINLNYSHDHHHSKLPLLTDEQGKLDIWSNANLTGTISMTLNNGIEMSAELNLNEAETEAVLFADCSANGVERFQLGQPISWTEALGLNDDIPRSETFAIKAKWQRINRNCEADSQFPGLRYQHPAQNGLVLIFDSAEMLIGVQIAVPEALVEDNEVYDYEKSSYYIKGSYNGEPAYFISLYMDDRKDVCRPKDISQLLCDPSLGQEAFVITKTSEERIFKLEKEALANGWHLQRMLPNRGSLMSSHNYDTEAEISDMAPYLVAYEKGELSGLIFLHFMSDADTSGLTLSKIFERADNPSDLFINAPEKLNSHMHKVVKSNFYLGNRAPRELVHEGDSLFYIKVKDDRGRAVEGAVIRLEKGEKQTMRAAQMATDRHGNAFIVFEGRVHEIEFSLENPARRAISEGTFWRSSTPYKLNRSHHRQTVQVETVTTAMVHVDVELDFEAALDFKIWTDKSGGKYWHKRLHHSGSKIEPFYVGLDANEIHILGHDGETSSIIYHIIEVDSNREVKGGSHGLDIYATIKSQTKSKLKVEEVQSEKGLSGATVELVMGVAHLTAQSLKLQVSSKYDNSVHLDLSEDGILVAWHVYGSDKHLPEIGTCVAPFHEKAKLLKIIDIHVHVCLLKYGHGQDESGSEKEAEVEAILEYEWASQDDSHEITPVDFKGNVFLKRLPSPSPGESLNVTLISRLGPQIFSQNYYHQSMAQLSASIHHDTDGPVHLNICHEQETVVVVVSNDVTNFKMQKVNVKLLPEGEEEMEAFTNEDGTALFSFDRDHSGQKFTIDVRADNYDPVHLSRFTHSSRRHTEIIHIKLLPRKTVRVHVNLASHHYHHVPAIGAVLDWTADDDGGIIGVNGHGKADLELSGKSETIHELTAFIPWQSTCGHSIDSSSSPLNKEVYGVARLRQDHFPLNHRPPLVADRSLTLPKIDKIYYQLSMDGLFPNKAVLHTDLMQRQETHDIARTILHDTASFYVAVGATHACLLLEEEYTATVVLAHLTTCFKVDPDMLENDDSIVLRQSIFSGTAKVTVKLVDHSFQPFTNATVDYVLAETAFGHNEVDVDEETGEVQFHVPEDMLVHIRAIPTNHAHPSADNPTYFIAKDGLVVHLIFGGSRFVSATVRLVGEGFEVPEGTMAQYVTRDLGGSIENRGLVSTAYDGTFDIELTHDTAYIEFSVGGSDGFVPIFFQPFDYTYTVLREELEGPPSYIEIPVKSIKNVIVSVKDCFTGEVIESESLVKFPEDAPVPHSQLGNKVSRHLGYPDGQGMAFFYLDADMFIPVEVSAHGYETFASKISVASNTTHLVEANLCKYITISMRLVDRERHNKPVHHAVISVSIDHDEEYQVTTDEQGYATIQTTTAMRHLSLQLMNADEAVKRPEFELHDDEHFLKEGEVDIEIKERMYSIELATASCHHFKHFSNVPVLVKIDDNEEFERSSDEHGVVRLHVRHSSKTVTAKVIGKPEQLHSYEHHHHSSIGLMPVNDLPKRFQFRFVSLPVLVALKLMDGYNDKRPVAHATVGVKLNQDGSKLFEVVTDKEGRAMFDMPTSTHTVTLQVLDARSDVVDPVFELRDDCSDFLDSNNVDIQVLERMYTVQVATASCHTFHHYSQVPVFVNIGYNDKATRTHLNIHEHSDKSKQWLFKANQGYDREKHLTDYTLVSNSEGIVTLRIHESASNISLTVLAPPPYKEDVVNLGLMPKDDLPDRFSFQFYSLPKELAVHVLSSSTEEDVFGAEIEVKYFDQNKDHHDSKTALTNREGKASISIDGCVEFASFIVTPPSERFCNAPALKMEKRLHWNVMTDQKFRIGLHEEENAEEIQVTIRTDLRHVDDIKYSTSRHDKVIKLHRPDPFFRNWHLSVKKNDGRINLLLEASRESKMALTFVDLCPMQREHDVDFLQDAVKVSIKVKDTNGNPMEGAVVIWHIGYGLGKAKTQTGSDGKAFIFAPKGHLLALEAKYEDNDTCRTDLSVHEAEDGKKLTLTCNN